MKGLNRAMFAMWCFSWMMFGSGWMDLLYYHDPIARRELILWVCGMIVTYLSHSILQRNGYKSNGFNYE